MRADINFSQGCPDSVISDIELLMMSWVIDFTMTMSNFSFYKAVTFYTHKGIN